MHVASSRASSLIFADRGTGTRGTPAILGIPAATRGIPAAIPAAIQGMGKQAFTACSLGDFHIIGLCSISQRHASRLDHNNGLRTRRHSG